jgi:hypothetical protein
MYRRGMDTQTLIELTRASERRARLALYVLGRIETKAIPGEAVLDLIEGEARMVVRRIRRPSRGGDSTPEAASYFTLWSVFRRL